MPEYFIGLMSGTSLDGVDGVVAHFSNGPVHLLANAHQPFDAALRSELLALNSPGLHELHRAAVAAIALAEIYALVVAELKQQLIANGLDPRHLRAVGAHGQTVRHQPNGSSNGQGGVGYSLQLLNPSLLAERCGVDVVADFRNRDIAAGGQGAPLVPAFHREVFGSPGEKVCVLNLGGIANVSVLPGDDSIAVTGFDCGPANVLLDAWCLRHTGAAFDADGEWAAGGHCHAELLHALYDEPFFTCPPPKSTGRDLFNMAWLETKLQAVPHLGAQDVQATLAELTAISCADSLQRDARDCTTLIVCGGGAFNRHVLQRLQHHLPSVKVTTSASYGMAPQHVEAAAFAWLARQTINRLPGNLPSVTGATGPRILGAIYPA